MVCGDNTMIPVLVGDITTIGLDRHSYLGFD
jgi:hypothetical protein